MYVDFQPLNAFLQIINKQQTKPHWLIPCCLSRNMSHCWGNVWPNLDTRQPDHEPWWQRSGVNTPRCADISWLASEASCRRRKQSFHIVQLHTRGQLPRNSSSGWNPSFGEYLVRLYIHSFKTQLDAKKRQFSWFMAHVRKFVAHIMKQFWSKWFPYSLNII